MNGILLVSHGKYAEAFRESLKMIAGNVDNVFSVCLEETDGPEEFKIKLNNVKLNLDRFEKIIVFADLLGGSPCNFTFQFFSQYENYSFISGMNFPMVLSTILSDEDDINLILKQGKEAIIDVKTFTESLLIKDEDD